MDELSEQLSTQLNETIIITCTYGSWWNIVDDKNKIKLVIHSNTQKLESTKIIQMYNEVREYRNSINKEFNLDCCIENNTNNHHITIKYDDCCINAKNYIVLSERVKKIEELKNQILSFGKEFNFSCINFNDHITIEINNIVDKVMITIYNNTTKFIEIYNEVREYRNSINKKYNLDCSIKKCSNNITIKYDAIIIQAGSYIELTEHVKKLEELKNKILSFSKDFDFIWNDCDEIYSFDNQINNISINIDIDCAWNDLDIDLIIESYNEIIAYKIDKDYKFIIEYNDDVYFKIEKNNIIDNMTYTISIETNKLSSIFEMYNQFREYINNNDKNFDFDCNISNNNEHDKIDISSYTDIDKNNEFNISISNSNNITSIIKIFIEVKNYIKSIEENNKKKQILNFYAEYNESIVKNINLELYDRFSWDKTKIEVNNYIELSEIIQLKEEEKKRLKEEEEKRLKEEEEKQEKLAIELSKFLKEDVIVEDINNESFIISGEDINKKFKIQIVYWNYGTKPLSFLPNDPCDIFPNIPNTNIRHIYNQVKNYKNINLKPEVIYYIDTLYTQTNLCLLTTKFTIKYNDCIFSGNNYYECDNKILEYIKMNELKLKEQESIKLKEEQEKVSTQLKLKYGDKTDWTITYINYPIYNIYNLVISNVEIEYIDLLDIIKTYPANIIINGYIKNTNYVDFQNIKDKSGCKVNWTLKDILNITIQNCPNLKIINNIIHCENNCNLKIVNCPKIEFIQNYNNFTEIYMNNCLVKVFNE
jgi:hypothetical protein